MPQVAPTMTAPNAIILLSGGLDSATVLAIARAEGYRCLTLSFDYGQRHDQELAAARAVARAGGAADHRIIRIDLRAFGGSALTDDFEVPKDRSLDAMEGGIPITYVPARNTIFLSFALAAAETSEAEAIYIGVNAIDYSGYPDCRPAFIDAFETVANLATRAGVEAAATPEAKRAIRILAPLMHMTKGQIIRRGLELGVDYGLTISCYDPDPAGRACGHCDACLLRAAGFAEAGVDDPAMIS